MVGGIKGIAARKRAEKEAKEKEEQAAADALLVSTCNTSR